MGGSERSDAEMEGVALAPTARPAEPFFSVVIPCYNEQESIEELYRRLRRTFEENIGTSFEFIFVSDGSTDATLPIILRLRGSDDRVKVISFSRNFGHQRLSAPGSNTRQETPLWQ